MIIAIANEWRLAADFGVLPTGSDLRRAGVDPRRTGVLGGSVLSKSSGLTTGPKDTRFRLALFCNTKSGFLFLPLDLGAVSEKKRIIINSFLFGLFLESGLEQSHMFIRYFISTPFTLVRVLNS